MLPPPGRKFCQCSSGCTATLREDSRWSYQRGHSPTGQARRALRRESRNSPAKSFAATSSATYTASITQARIELDLLASEFDRLEDEAIAAERTAKAARAAAAASADRHELVTQVIRALEEMMGKTPTPENVVIEKRERVDASVDELTGYPTHVFVCLEGPENIVLGVLTDKDAADAWMGLADSEDDLRFRHCQRVALGMANT